MFTDVFDPDVSDAGPIMGVTDVMTGSMTLAEIDGSVGRGALCGAGGSVRKTG